MTNHFTYLFDKKGCEHYACETKMAAYLKAKGIKPTRIYREIGGKDEIFRRMLRDLMSARGSKFVYYIFECNTQYDMGIRFTPVIYGAKIRIVPRTGSRQELQVIKRIEEAGDRMQQAMMEINPYKAIF